MHTKDIETDEDFALPDDLTPDGYKAWRLIKNYLVDNKLTFTGGCKLFYSPKQWKERRESYGVDSLLVVVYEGAAAGRALSYDKAYEYARPGTTDCYDLLENLQKTLNKAGFFFEQCTTWYSAIYKA